MTQHGFLERTDRPDRRRRAAAQAARRRDPAARHRRRPTRRSATRSRCCTSTASRSCRSSARTTRTSVVGSIGERGLLKHAVDDPALLGAEIVDVMEPPFPAVSAERPGARGRRAAGRRPPGAAGHRATGRARASSRAPTCSRRWRDDASASRTRAVHAGLEPDPPTARSSRPIHQTSTFAQPRRRRVRRGLRLRALAPTRRARRSSARSGELEGGLGIAFSSGMAATHALLTAVVLGRRPRRPPRRPLRRHVPPRRQGARALGPALHDGRPDRPRRAAPPRCADDTRLIWVETPTNPLLNVVDIAGVVGAQARRARRRRQHLRHAGQPAPARARRRRRRALDDEVPRRALRHRRRRGRSCATPTCTSRCASCRTSIGAVPGPVRLLPRAPRPAHAAPAHARARRERRGRRRLPARRRRASTTCAGPGFSGMVSFRHPDAVAHRRGHASSSRWPSRSAASSRSSRSRRR